ncbi:hypothetical protein NM208_g9491 [Fusarium decemcellulare]|uniref:Uncharacterized protein n=1 Tax=Fusarium decemcellulare TaxID=57161 RepID=A0ACC1S1C4_9HYPO|nr:hypothetical protein NM208_g9491 [Fusarium decemcellulare]
MSVEPVLLTIPGFVVGLSLSFRTATSYERYAESRRYWAQLVHASQSLARVFWIHASNPENVDIRESLLRKISCLNLIVALAVSLKHKLRFEPYTSYDDLAHLVGHLDTLANKATALEPNGVRLKKHNFFKSVGEYLGVSFATSNPCKTLKRATHPVGNLPAEILSRLSCVVDQMVEDGQLKVPMQQTIATTPCPSSATSYPASTASTPLHCLWHTPSLSLVEKLKWVCIPASIAASYIILGILFIGQQIENPFGQDVNDLPL